MSEQSIITLRVLRSDSQETLGETRPVTISNPCKFGNSGGALLTIETQNEVRRVAGVSADHFKKAMANELAAAAR